MEARYLRAEYWRDLAEGELHVEDGVFLSRRSVVPLICETSHARRDLAEQGVSLLKVNEDEEDDWEACPTGWGVDLEAMCRVLEKLANAGWPAIFILVYDEAWVVRGRLAWTLNQLRLEPNLDFAAFRVAGSDAGWPPHRDRDDAAHVKSVRDGFFTDETPMHVTCWIALSEATPDASCLYCVPKKADPGYSETGLLLKACFSNPTSFQNIRALPCPTGGCLMFSHRLLHWGSKRLSSSVRPRCALSFGSNPVNNATPLHPSPAVRGLPFASGDTFLDGRAPALDARLALAAAQFFVYARSTVATVGSIGKNDNHTPPDAPSSSPDHSSKKSLFDRLQACFHQGNHHFHSDFVSHVQAEILIWKSSMLAVV